MSLDAQRERAMVVRTMGRTVTNLANITAEESAFWVERLRTLMVLVSTPHVVGDVYDPAAGTGTLVRLGERDFVFTAGHVVEGYSTRDIALAFPRTVLTLPVVPGQEVTRVWCSPGDGKQPDAAVLELRPARRNVWRNHVALTSADFAPWRPLSIDERLIVAGFPSQEQSTKRSGIDPIAVAADRLSFESAVTAITLVSKRRDVTDNPHAPDDGRCFHVVWGDDLGDPHDLDVLPQRIHPRGVSGGPVIAIDGGGRRCVGLVRSAFREQQLLLCEPATEPFRLLVDHEDSAVREEVRAVLARLEA